jgi:hypothetical protein
VRHESLKVCPKNEIDKRAVFVHLDRKLLHDSLENCSNLPRNQINLWLCVETRLDSTAVSTKCAIKSASRAHRKARHSSLVTIFCLLLKLFTLQACLLTCFCVHNTNSSNCGLHFLIFVCARLSFHCVNFTTRKFQMEYYRERELFQK